MNIIDICVIVFLGLAGLSKLADVLTTLRYVSAETETNPIGQALMRRFGVRDTCWGVFILGWIVLFLVGAVSILWGNTFIKILVSAEGALLTAFHLSAGYYNMYHRQNIFIRIGLWVNRQLRQLFSRLVR